MVSDHTPSSILYQLLKQLKVKNNEAAAMLVSSTQSYGGKLLIDRIQERTFLSRLTHAKPGMLPDSAFSDPVAAAQTLCARVVNNDSRVTNMSDLVDVLSGDAADEMATACRSLGKDGALFSNMATFVAEHPGLSDADRASALMLLYVVSGCLGDPVRATEQVRSFIAPLVGRGFQTDLAAEVPPNDPSTAKTADPEDIRLGLVRVIDGGLDLANVYVLSLDPAGTIVGSMATDAHAINDVGPLVSKRHVRVFRDEAGRWFAEGLGSTNGTKLIDGADKYETVLEAPKFEREGGRAASRPLRIQPGDALHLAGTTVFLVIKLA